MRFATRALDRGVKLGVQAIWIEEGDDSVKVKSLDGLDPKYYADWGLSDTIDLKGAVPLYKAIRDIRVQFVMKGKIHGGWLVDDVMVDPMKRG